MSDTVVSLERKIKSAGELRSVVRTMKAIAASRITQYENSVRALGDYHRSVELGLGAYFREAEYGATAGTSRPTVVQANARQVPTSVVVFGSDQGLVGQFNRVLAEYTAEVLKPVPHEVQIWAVGERVHASLLEQGLRVIGGFAVPTSVAAIVPLVGRVQAEIGVHRGPGEDPGLIVFHNRPLAGGLYEATRQRLLPLDADWQQRLARTRWPNRNLPEVLPGGNTMLRALVGEYLFISIFRACAESLASENASLLAAMARAERNIDQLSARLLTTFRALRQDGIDEELFDVVSGYEAQTIDARAAELLGTTQTTETRT